MRNSVAALAAIAIFMSASASAGTPAGAPAENHGKADLVVLDARIHTVNSAHPDAQAMAVKAGRIVFVGADEGAQDWVGKTTKVVHLQQRRVLPGLVDSHIHAMDIVDLDVCDLASKPVTLRELTMFAHSCIERYKIPAGGRLSIHQWNYVGGNQPNPQTPTLRAALDAASTTHQIELLGNDGHHGAFNSLALASAKRFDGKVVGLSKVTLDTDFAAYKKVIGVDDRGEPNGAVNEDARLAIDPHAMLNTDLDEVAKAPERVPQRLNSVGITAFMDAMVTHDALAVYDLLFARGNLTAHATLAQFYDPERFRKADGSVDYDRMVGEAKAVRAKYAGNSLIRADFIKLFADGVLEGNPFAEPPMLPNGASLRPYLQPIFAVDAGGLATVKGYVDTNSALCARVRAETSKYETAAAADEFYKAHGYYPAQCTISSGQLQHDRQTILDFVRAFHLAGFNLHIHAIGDRAVRTAVDAIEAARKADGNAATRDSLAHLQLVHPDDVARVGRDGLYVAFTYGWMNVDPSYDMTVIPFFERVSGNTYSELHRPDSYYERNVYPVRSVKRAGGILTAGSDAPIETRDPRPFINMARAIDRRLPGGPALGKDQTIDIDAAIDAYTINGARMLGIEKIAGSIESGKSADFIVLDRDVIALAASGDTNGIAATHVAETWFQGRKVYSR